jgi:exopolysaccharide production protein ExoZ
MQTIATKQEPKRQQPASKELKTVQALRFLAAFTVVCLHSTFYTHERLDPDFPLYHQGAHGVRLFFVISGLVMILSSARLAEQAHGWLVFSIKRIVRIVPLYWLILSVKAAILLLTSGFALHTKFDPAFVAKSFFFIPAYNLDGEIMPLHGVGWTLNFEMFFYTLFALALLFRMPPTRTLGPVLILLALASNFRTTEWPVALRFYCDPVVLDFLGGMVIARWIQRGFVIPPIAAWIMVAAGLVGLFLPFPLPPLSEITYSLIITILSVITIMGAAALEPLVSTKLPRWLMLMGAASYALYLIHPIVAPSAPYAMAKLGIPLPLLSILASVVVASIFGTIIYLFVETPISNFLNSRLQGSALFGLKSRSNHTPLET